VIQCRGGELVQAIPTGVPGRGKKGGKASQLGKGLIATSVAARWVSLTRRTEAAP
jgi:hypothetical protein